MTTIAFKFIKGCFIPLGRFRREVDENFDEGNIYHLAEVKGRSAASHNHYFACLHEAWVNLPEGLAMRFPSEEHLRKHALIRTGWHNTMDIAVGTRAAAVRVAEAFHKMDVYCAAVVTGTAVTVFTPKSQSARAMEGEEFQKSKRDVLDFLEDAINVPRGALMKKVTDT